MKRVVMALAAGVVGITIGVAVSIPSAYAGVAIGRPPGNLSTHPLFPSGVLNEVDSRSRFGDGRFTFTAVFKSIRRMACFAGPSASLLAAAATVLTSWFESGLHRAVTPRSKLKLILRDSIQLVWEDIKPPWRNAFSGDSCAWS